MSVYLVKQLGWFMSINVGSICNVIVLYYVHFLHSVSNLETGMGMKKQVWVK